MKLSYLLPAFGIFLSSSAMAADHNEKKDFGIVAPNQDLDATVTPPGTVLTGNVKTAGGFQWIGGPATWTTTVPGSFAGAHAGEFEGTYQPSGTGTEPHVFTWDLKTSAESEYKRTPPGEVTQDPVAYAGSFGANNDLPTARNEEGNIHVKYSRSDDRKNAERKIIVRMSFSGGALVAVTAFRFSINSKAAASAYASGSIGTGTYATAPLSITTDLGFLAPTPPGIPVPIPVPNVTSPRPQSSQLTGTPSIWETEWAAHAPNSAIDESHIPVVYAGTSTSVRGSGRADAVAIIGGDAPTGGLSFRPVN